MLGPPKLAKQILNAIVRDNLLEEILGDLEEEFYLNIKRKSVTRAKLIYWYQTLNYIRPFAMRKRKHQNRSSMLGNNIRIGWRQLLRQKMYSSIKIGGFALGIAASLLITLYIIDEVSFDTQAKNAHRIYRVYQTYQTPEKLEKWVWFQAPFAKTVKLEFPEVELAGRYNHSELFGVGNGQFRRDDQPDNTYEDKIVYVDGELLELLEVPFIHGDAKSALNEPNEIVISQKKAEKYFGKENPIGRLMVYNNNNEKPFKIGGVVEDFPSNSHLDFDFMIGLAEREMWPGESNYWGATNYPTYVLLREGTDPVEFEKKLKKIAENYVGPFDRSNGDTKVDEWLAKTTYGVQPIQDIHLYTSGAGIDNPVTNNGDIRFVWLFAAIAIFIVLIACINFINLSTAKSAQRAKEVGLRKTVGSYRGQIIHQFLTESLIFSVISFVIGILLAWLCLPMFNNIAGKALLFPWTQTWFAPAIVISAIVVGLFAGLYPAFYLSSFRPAEVLKGNFARSGKNAFTRSALVVFQFTTSIVLIISTVVIYQQVNHIMTAKLGYEKDQVIMIQGTAILKDQVTVFKNELEGLSSVQSVTISDYLPVIGTKRNGNMFNNQGKRNIEPGVGGQFWGADADYAKTLGLKVVEGRFFERDKASDSTSIVINRKMAKELGLTDPIGKIIANYRDWTIIGVVEDFRYSSVRDEIEPLTMVLGGSTNTVTIKLDTEDIQSTIAGIETIWKKLSPHQPLRIAFMDETFARMYDDVQRMGYIFTCFAVLAIVVACLGLFALSAFMVEQRGKEVSIRLVLGASLRSVFGLLTSTFMKLVLVSFVLAAPIAWYMMDKWLSGFSEKTSVGWEVYVLAGSMATVIAMATISYQSLKAGLVKPVNNLRSE